MLSATMTEKNNSLPEDFIPLKKRKPLSEKQLARNRASAGIAAAASLVVRREKKLKRAHVEKLADQTLLAGIRTALRTQMIAMVGTHKMLEIKIEEVGAKTYRREIPVHDIARIDELLAHGIVNEDYRIVEGTSPDWKAAEAFLSRALPKENVLTIKGKIQHEHSLKGLSRNTKRLPSHVLENPFEPLPPKYIETKAIEQPSKDAS